MITGTVNSSEFDAACIAEFRSGRESASRVLALNIVGKFAALRDPTNGVGRMQKIGSGFPSLQHPKQFETESKS